MKAIVFLFFLVLPVFMGDASYAEDLFGNMSCSSAGGTGIQNATINNVANGMNIKLVNGVACSSDGFGACDPVAVSQRSQNRAGGACTSYGSGHCEWQHEISKDEVLNPAPGKQARLVVIDSDHISGSGEWETVIVFDCSDGHVRTILENRYLYGVKISRNTDKELILTSGYKLPKDPECCPSENRREIYRWSTSGNTYMFESTAIFPAPER